jgi:hypothetical protein
MVHLKRILFPQLGSTNTKLRKVRYLLFRKGFNEAVGSGRPDQIQIVMVKIL